MPKILIKRAKKQFVEHLNKEIVVASEDIIYVSKEGANFSTRHGLIRKEDLAKPDGSKIKSEKGDEFIMITPSFVDEFYRMRRLPQTIPLKDIGWIITKTGIGPETRVLDSGSGSGALAIQLARHCREVVTYDINDEHLECVRENLETLGVKNVIAKKGDITKGIPETGFDLAVYDLPDPWDAIETAHKALKVGGFLVSYSPTIPQTADFCNTIEKDDRFLVLETVEMIERPWEMNGRKVRPISKEIIHSGFLTMARKIL